MHSGPVFSAFLLALTHLHEQRLAAKMQQQTIIAIKDIACPTTKKFCNFWEAALSPHETERIPGS